MVQGLRNRQALYQSDPGDLGLQGDLAAAMLDAAELTLVGGKPAEAEKQYRFIIDKFGPDVTGQKRGPAATEALGKAYDHLSHIYELRKPPDLNAALRNVDLAVETYRGLEVGNPDEPRYRGLRLSAEAGRGLILWLLGRNKEAGDALAATVADSRALVMRYPAVRDYRQGLAMALVNAATVALEQKDARGAIAALEEARVTLALLHRAFPDAHNYRKQLVTLTRKLAELKEAVGAKQEATDLRDEARRLEAPPG